MPRRLVVLTVATNGLDRRYRQCIDTHSAYAARHGYEHFLVSNIGCRLAPDESAWLRIPIMRILIESGPVFYVDSDAEIRPTAPPIDSVQVPGKSVYMAHGISGRFNSGVIYLSEESAADYLDEVLSNYHAPVPRTDQALYENGHIIHFARKYSHIIQRLDDRWNNTASEEMDDYIRHYTNALRHLRPGYKLGLFYYTASKAKRMKRILFKTTKPVPDKTMPEKLTLLASQVVAAQFPG